MGIQLRKAARKNQRALGLHQEAASQGWEGKLLKDRYSWGSYAKQWESLSPLCFAFLPDFGIGMPVKNQTEYTWEFLLPAHPVKILAALPHSMVLWVYFGKNDRDLP